MLDKNEDQNLLISKIFEVKTQEIQTKKSEIKFTPLISFGMFVKSEIERLEDFCLSNIITEITGSEKKKKVFPIKSNAKINDILIKNRLFTDNTQKSNLCFKSDFIKIEKHKVIKKRSRPLLKNKNKQKTPKIKQNYLDHLFFLKNKIYFFQNRLKNVESNYYNSFIFNKINLTYQNESNRNLKFKIPNSLQILTLFQENICSKSFTDNVSTL